MTKTTIWTLILSLSLTSAAFAATDEEKCQNKKLIALGKRDLCLQKERGKEVFGKTPDTAKCEEKFDTKITKADEAAAKKSASCRWLDNGDGTATDLNSGLQWELKTDGGLHDWDDVYRWSIDVESNLSILCGQYSPNGSAFVDFIPRLNGKSTDGGYNTEQCFADKCDWRLPTIDELATLGSLCDCGCGRGWCSTIPGKTHEGLYLSSTHDDGGRAFALSFGNGGRSAINKHITDAYVRAVRGGS